MDQKLRQHGHYDDTLAGYAAKAARDGCCRCIFALTCNRLRPTVPGDQFIAGRIPFGHR